MATPRGESAAIVAIDSNGFGFRLRFGQLPDRYAHAISLVTPVCGTVWKPTTVRWRYQVSVEWCHR